MRRILVISHVAHEGLGSFEPMLLKANCTLILLRADEPKAAWPSLANVDAIISMGGPQSVYQQAAYPYLKREIQLLRDAVKMDMPVLGVCLGSQLLAASLGAAVEQNVQKEIGWYPVMREPGADGDPLWAAFGQTETVFQWHGDRFAIPKGATQLASAPLCDEQAFRYGRRAYGLQFHLEVTEPMIRAWIMTNKAELAALKGVIDPEAIKRQSQQHLKRLADLSRHVIQTFAGLVPDIETTLAPKPVPDIERPLPKRRA